jgi:hypothetical protein
MAKKNMKSLVDMALELDEEIKEKTKRLNALKSELKEIYGHGDIVEGKIATAVFWDAERRAITALALERYLVARKKKAVFYDLVSVGLGKVETLLGPEVVEELAFVVSDVSYMKLTRKENAEKVLAKLRKERAIDF